VGKARRSAGALGQDVWRLTCDCGAWLDVATPQGVSIVRYQTDPAVRRAGWRAYLWWAGWGPLEDRIMCGRCYGDAPPPALTVGNNPPR
jgi:hypothetical protein